MAYKWEVSILIKDDKGEVVETLTGWELSDSTFYGINHDVEDFIENNLQERTEA